MQSKRSLIFIILGNLLLFQEVYSQNLPVKTVLDSMVSQLKSQNHFTYQAKHQQKYFDREDTLKTDWFRIRLQKEPADSILGFYMEMNHPNESRIYDGEKLSLVWHNENLVQLFPTNSTKENFYANNIRKELIPRFLYESGPFKSYIENGTLTQYSTIERAGKTYYRIQYDFPVDEEITLLQRTLLINSKTLLPEMVEGYAEYMNIQKEWFLLEINYEKTTSLKENWKELNHPSEYKIEYPNLPENTFNPALSIGTEVSEISASNLNGQPYLLNFPPLDSSLYLIDFWHVGCAPCLKAMPELENLYTKYKTAGLKLVGLNPMDEGRKELVSKFKERLQINYELLLISPETAQGWKVKIFPTLYLVKNGKIVYSKIGYREEDILLLEEQILSYLKKP